MKKKTSIQVDSEIRDLLEAKKKQLKLISIGIVVDKLTKYLDKLK